jgi:hypothetical protein
VDDGQKGGEDSGIYTFPPSSFAFCVVLLPMPSRVPFLTRLKADLTPLLRLEVEIIVYIASTNAVALDKSEAIAD